MTLPELHLDAWRPTKGHPEPDGLHEQPLPLGAWVEVGAGSLAVLPYETVRTARDPRTTLLAFCQSVYETGAGLAGWDMTSFVSRWCPTSSELEQLRATVATDFSRPAGVLEMATLRVLLRPPVAWHPHPRQEVGDELRLSRLSRT